MPRGGGSCCVSREQRQLDTMTVFCNETFRMVPYLEIPVRFVRCLNPIPFGIGHNWIGDGDGAQSESDRGQFGGVLSGDG